MSKHRRNGSVLCLSNLKKIAEIEKIMYKSHRTNISSKLRKCYWEGLSMRSKFYFISEFFLLLTQPDEAYSTRSTYHTVQPSDSDGVTHPYFSCVFTSDRNASSADSLLNSLPDFLVRAMRARPFDKLAANCTITASTV